MSRTHTTRYRFRRGQKVQLDAIYLIAGLGEDLGGRWWEPDDDAGEDITITRDIDIMIAITDEFTAGQRSAGKRQRSLKAPRNTP